MMDSNHDYTLESLVSKILQARRYHDRKCVKCRKGYCPKHMHDSQSVKISLTSPKSTYQSAYKKSDKIPNDCLLPPVENRKFSTIIGDSSYKSDYIGSTQLTNIQSYGKKRDNLKLGGPLFSSSTYQNSYHQNNNIPKKQTLIINPQTLGKQKGMKLIGSSSYKDSYRGMGNMSRALPIKRQGSLKVNGSFIGQSSYNQHFISVKSNKAESFKPKPVYVPSLSYKTPTSYNAEYKSIENYHPQF